MALIDQVYLICQKYQSKGWRDLLLLVAGLDIAQGSADKLAIELARDLTEDSGINRDTAGFQDFNLAGSRGIEPGKPAQSLLYHAFASPGVVADSLSDYPSLAEIEIVENYIFAAAKRSLSGYTAIAKGSSLGVCVFAYDYRPGYSSVLKKSAQLCFSRTGVARVGNQPYAYVPERRGFVPWKTGDDDDTLRVVPARYGVFLCIMVDGDDDTFGEFGPMEKNFLHDNPDADYTPYELDTDEIPDDNDLSYWVPVHKLFSGTECLTDFTASTGLNVSLEAYHVNQKLARVESTLGERLYSTTSIWAPVPDSFREPPFTITDGLASLSGADPILGSNCVVPKDQPITQQAQIVDSSQTTGLTFAVKPLEEDMGFDYLFSSFNIEAEDNGAHRGPEYLNVRQQVTPTAKNLNQDSTTPILDTLEAGDFTAKAYLDSSADGFIKPIIPELGTTISIDNYVPAYSLIAPPRFIPYVNQREIIVWTEERMRSGGMNYKNWPRMWAVLPWALSEDRIGPNIELPESNFESSDLTVTCIVSMPEDPTIKAANIVDFQVKRMDFLTDAAAGTFAPGWDTSYDTDSSGNPFLSAYGLGSPFPEDAMICSALGSFWPTAAPDTTRLYPSTSNWRTVAPLTDKEIGLDGGTSWDGTPPPQLVTSSSGPDSVVYQDFNYNDYVQNAIAGKVTIKLLQEIDATEYKNRVLAIYHSYLALLAVDPDFIKYLDIQHSGDLAKVPATDWNKYAQAWVTLSFKKATAKPIAELTAAGVNPETVSGSIYEIVMFQGDKPKKRTPAFNQVTVEIITKAQLYAYSTGIILKSADLTSDKWTKGKLPI